MTDTERTFFIGVSLKMLLSAEMERRLHLFQSQEDPEGEVDSFTRPPGARSTVQPASRVWASAPSSFTVWAYNNERGSMADISFLTRVIRFIRDDIAAEYDRGVEMEVLVNNSDGTFKVLLTVFNHSRHVRRGVTATGLPINETFIFGTLGNGVLDAAKLEAIATGKCL